MNKTGYSIGFTWVFGLVMLFGIGVLYITFSQVFDAHLVPTVKELANDSSITGIDISNETTKEIHGNIDKYMAFFHSLPFILFGIIIIYMVVAAFKKEGESY